MSCNSHPFGGGESAVRGGVAPRSPPVPSGPSGALHTCGAVCAGVWFGASARCSARPRHRPRVPQPGPPAPPVPSTPVGPCVLACGSVRCLGARPGHCHSSLPLEIFMPVWPGVLLCVLAPHPACTRYKVRPARLVGGENGRKFAMRAQNTPNWAFLGEQGEFYTAHAVRRGVQGEFCTGSGAV